MAVVFQIEFSPNETYVLTWDGSPAPLRSEKAVRIWKVMTGTSPPSVSASLRGSPMVVVPNETVGRHTEHLIVSLATFPWTSVLPRILSRSASADDSCRASNFAWVVFL